MDCKLPISCGLPKSKAYQIYYRHSTYHLQHGMNFTLIGNNNAIAPDFNLFIANFAILHLNVLAPFTLIQLFRSFWYFFQSRPYQCPWKIYPHVRFSHFPRTNALLVESPGQCYFHSTLLRTKKTAQRQTIAKKRVVWPRYDSLSGAFKRPSSYQIHWFLL